MPEVQIVGGGAHAAGRIDLQDVMVVPLGASSFQSAMEWVAEIYRAAGEILREEGRLAGVADEGGYWPVFRTNREALECTVRAIERAGRRPGEEVALSLDIAANQLHDHGRYRLGLDEVDFDRDGFAERILSWCREFPVVSVEDPLVEDDMEGMVLLTRALDGRVQVVGDDFLVTDAERTRHAARRTAASALLVKPNQAGTVSRARAALEAARVAEWGTIVSARSGETEDVSVVHLAVGWQAGQLKVGSFSRSERMAKWNEAIRIEQGAGSRARFAGRGAVRAPKFGA